MSAQIIAVDFIARRRAPCITLQSPPVDTEDALARHVKAIARTRGVPTSEWGFVVAKATARWRAGEALDRVHQWAREFCRELAAAIHRRGPQGAA